MYPQDIMAVHSQAINTVYSQEIMTAKRPFEGTHFHKVIRGVADRGERPELPEVQTYI